MAKELNRKLIKQLILSIPSGWVAPITVFIVIATFVPGAVAHHSLTPHYDVDSSVTIEGVITDFKLVNPHAFIYVDVTNDDGTVSNWNCGLDAASKLSREGWTEELFAPGKTIMINGIMARRDPHGCSLLSGSLEGEIQFSRRGGISNIEKRQIEKHVATVEDLTSFSGLWSTPPRALLIDSLQGNSGPGVSGQSGQPSDNNRLTVSMTDAGVSVVDKYDVRFDDPALQCSPSSIIWVWSRPNGISEIEHTDEQLIIRHAFMDTVRVVHLDTQEHPESIESSLTGHSVGWFEDDVLVVDTIGFNSGVLVPQPAAGYGGGVAMNTENMHIVERLSLADDGQRLIREYEVIDSEYWKKPYTGRSEWIRTSISLSTYDCTELSGISSKRPEDSE